ncbi:hypothetical protein [Streptomyces aidingensis]|uniref:Helix-turn-helix domain-containing protein n=1 Tax=Streptomyces aidingensis TaxID=910347 RepID=A0A1I1UUM9_9ACTN|nr:hypothetical protein [Streptomyces aidingensis]SFD74522.1 hypothetical protein SAMN05421773_12723 [Streptomyces aidingensis]
MTNTTTTHPTVATDSGEAAEDVPNLGAHRAAELLTDRFGINVDPDILIELARTGLIPTAGTYKGHQLYNGQALAAFTDRDALERACDVGRLLTRDQAAAHLRIRTCDIAHLVRSGRLTPATYVCSSQQPRSWGPQVPLYRAGDLEELLAAPGIDWEAVRATPAGRRSPLAALPTRT